MRCMCCSVILRCLRQPLPPASPSPPVQVSSTQKLRVGDSVTLFLNGGNGTLADEL